MELIRDISEMQRRAMQLRLENRHIGFVPTMGAFHDGHLSLMRHAREENDVLIISIYVNPKQFGPAEDFASYPRDMERDAELAELEGVDIIFYPDDSTMYPAGYQTYVDVKNLTSTLCGKSRPGHFQGVTTVVSKLFQIVLPHTAYFGQKDAQQALVLKRMTQDLNFPVTLSIQPTVREPDGLAMSSRNVYLKPEERKQALALYNSLQFARTMIGSGETSAAVIKSAMTGLIRKESHVTIDYLEIVDSETLSQVDSVHDTVLIAGAVYLGKTRLIDNMVINGATGEEVTL